MLRSLLPGLVFLLALSVANAAKNPELQSGERGSEAVLFAIARIQQSGAFNDDNNLLRRIAFVETRDGENADTFRDGYFGGIWAVDEVAFLRTKDTSLNSRLPAKLGQIENLLRISWSEAEWEDLRKPLYSAIAARLVLYLVDRAIPNSNSVQAQAEFWRQNYNEAGSVSDFISLTSGLESKPLFCYQI